MLRQAHKIKKRPDMQKTGQKIWKNRFMRCVINIPKNLIRIFLVLSFASFVYIAYVLSNEQYHQDFINQDRQFEN